MRMRCSFGSRQTIKIETFTRCKCSSVLSFRWLHELYTIWSSSFWISIRSGEHTCKTTSIVHCESFRLQFFLCIFYALHLELMANANVANDCTQYSLRHFFFFKFMELRRERWNEWKKNEQNEGSRNKTSANDEIMVCILRTIDDIVVQPKLVRVRIRRFFSLQIVWIFRCFFFFKVYFCAARVQIALLQFSPFYSDHFESKY